MEGTIYGIWAGFFVDSLLVFSLSIHTLNKRLERSVCMSRRPSVMSMI